MLQGPDKSKQWATSSHRATVWRPLSYSVLNKAQIHKFAYNYILLSSPELHLPDLIYSCVIVSKITREDPADRPIPSMAALICTICAGTHSCAQARSLHWRNYVHNSAPNYWHPMAFIRTAVLLISCWMINSLLYPMFLCLQYYWTTHSQPGFPLDLSWILSWL